MGKRYSPLSVQDALRKLEAMTGFRPQSSGKGWLAKCPIHSDSNPSLGVMEVHGQAFFNCFAGCDWKDVADSIRDGEVRYSQEDVHKLGEKKKHIPFWLRKVVIKYPYTTEHGELLFYKVRYEPKTFSIERPDGTYGLPAGITPPLYNLPNVVNSTTVFIVEGEKAADAINKLGLVATTSWGGASVWLKADNVWFKDKHVVVLPDNDSAGLGYANLILDSFVESDTTPASLRVIKLPGLAEKEDPYDWVAKGGTVAELRKLFLNTREHDVVGLRLLLQE